ncbi:hypothetical protein GCM10022403_010980 [Streptomyces coacervatus]|uniref:Serine/threonine protein kinase n=1 Tax=Streptomyces coacervatus TaxID=647381 RepID=A0ABP7H2I6_9ACTN|nr:hypothetical protein [Streptomyces coacervatus]MDF2272270.1 hypothetical protein [Streptomyces coacervatus]
MKRPGPLLTLLAGLLFGVFMLTLNSTTGTKTASSPYKENSPAVSAPPTPSAKSPSATSTPSRTAAPSGVYTGRTDDDSSAVAVSLRGGKAIAYFCDGHNIESWLKGDVKADGSLSLTGDHGAKLNGTLKGSKQLRGTADLGGGHYTFTIDKAKKPSGIYRANSQVAGARIVGGWIVLPGGKQVGIVTRNGEPSAAPTIDPQTGATTVDGQQLTAHPVTP